jgi:hypothetical protein
MRTRCTIALLAAAWLASAAHAQAPPQEFDCRAPASLPVAVRGFVEARTCAIALERADLDRDGRADFLLVLERLDPAPNPDDGRLRSLLVLVAGDGGRLRAAARSDRVVACTRCGGIWGDPFDGIDAGPGTFTVNHYGGSAWRWRADYTFGYSPRDRAWQLVRVSTLSYHNSNPDSMTKRVYTPPRHFGKIDLREFDPENYRGRGRR